ncbi:hypothetical protein Mapa_001313 [Marchantia paleacea]|nr:hypothetical protein Mapa_001313 [Marchantia paleacea]
MRRSRMRELHPRQWRTFPAIFLPASEAHESPQPISPSSFDAPLYTETDHFVALLSLSPVLDEPLLLLLLLLQLRAEAAVEMLSLLLRLLPCLLHFLRHALPRTGDRPPGLSSILLAYHSAALGPPRAVSPPLPVLRISSGFSCTPRRVRSW